MIFKLYSIKDNLEGYHPPLPFNTEEMADRWFREQEQTATKILVTPDDFSLWYMGTFDIETGEIKSECKLVRKAVNYAKSNSNT